MHRSLDFYYALFLSLSTHSPSHLFVKRLILYQSVAPMTVTEELQFLVCDAIQCD